MSPQIAVLIVIFMTGATLFIWAHSPQIVQTVFGWISPSMPSLPTISTPPTPMSVTFGWDETIPTPWLFWETALGHRTAELCVSFVGTTVWFDTSRHYRAIFGFSTVAHCEGGGEASDQDLSLDFRPMTVRIYLDGNLFGGGGFVTKKGRRVYGCDKLTLLQDGRMYASGAKYRPKQK